MAAAVQLREQEMSNFDELVDRLRRRLDGREDISLSVDVPVRPDGFYVIAIVGPDDYLVEVEWQRHRGFGLVAGRDLMFGTGVDEIYGSVNGAFDRVMDLVDTGAETSADAPLPIGDLRKLRGRLQKDVAGVLGISKSGLAQMERPSSLTSMQIDTLQRLIASLGGELVLTARFPDGQERRIAAE